MTPNSYKIVSDCVSDGIEQGWNKAHKHTETPSEQILKDQIEHYILLNIGENFLFDDKLLDRL